MKKNYTDITMILDRSGSMATVAKDIIGGVNTFVDSQKKVQAEILFSLHQFDNEYETVYNHILVGDVTELTDKTYMPRGSTALYDAIGKTVNSTGQRFAGLKEEERPEKVVVVIVTDGLENSSREFNSNQIREMIKHQKETYNWEFVFLAANQDAILEGDKMEVKTSNSMTFSPTTKGIQQAFMSTANNVSMYAAGVATSCSYQPEDRKKQEVLLKTSPEQ